MEFAQQTRKGAKQVLNTDRLHARQRASRSALAEHLVEKPRLREAFLAKDCYFNKKGTIVNFRNVHPLRIILT